MKYKFVNTRTKVIVFILDIMGFLLWVFFHLFTPWKIIAKKRIPQNPDKILLIRADYIGDVLLTTHTLKSIRNRFPKSNISFLVSQKSREILEGNPYIDNIIVYDPPWFFRSNCQNAFVKCFKEYLNLLSLIKKQRFDLAADFRGDVRNILFLMVFAGIPNRVSFAASGGWYLLTKIAEYIHYKHEAEYHTIIAEALEASVNPSALPEIFLENKDRDFINEFLDKNNLNNSMLAVIQPGARRVVRQWHEERYAEVGKYLISKYGAKIILTGSPDEIPLLEKVNTLMNGQTFIAAYEINSLKHLSALFERCNLYIGVSSGPSHFAAAAGLPSVLLFGPELVSQWRPIGNRYVIIKKDFPCCPCNQKNCRRLEENCIRAITVNDVIDGIENLLKQIQ